MLRLLWIGTARVAKMQTDLRGLPPNQQELRRSLMRGYNFTDHVRTSLARAREEAQQLHHEYVGTEHILLGMTKAADNTGCVMLTQLGVDIGDLRSAVA